MEPQKNGNFSTLRHQNTQQNIADLSLLSDDSVLDTLLEDPDLVKESLGDEAQDDATGKNGFEHLSEGASMDQIETVARMLDNVLLELEKIRRHFRDIAPVLRETQRSSPPRFASPAVSNGQLQELGRIVEGVFDGQGMIGSDGKEYTVPPNYASKSKLLEGDTLKLTIESDGKFIYKQICPVDRKRITAILDYDTIKNQYIAMSGDKVWRLLMAAVTYFKGEKGDEVILLVPRGKPSRFAAVENIIKHYRV